MLHDYIVKNNFNPLFLSTIYHMIEAEFKSLYNSPESTYCISVKFISNLVRYFNEINFEKSLSQCQTINDSKNSAEILSILMKFLKLVMTYV